MYMSKRLSVYACVRVWKTIDGKVMEEPGFVNFWKERKQKLQVLVWDFQFHALLKTSHIVQGKSLVPRAAWGFGRSSAGHCSQLPAWCP